MTQFLDQQDADFLFYYTRPEYGGKDESNEPDPLKRFEHKVRIPYSAVQLGKRFDNTDDDDVVQVACPCGCGAMASVPLLGGEEAQRLHAHFKAHREARQYAPEVVTEVMEMVRARGGIPRLIPPDNM